MCIACFILIATIYPILTVFGLTIIQSSLVVSAVSLVLCLGLFYYTSEYCVKISGETRIFLMLMYISIIGYDVINAVFWGKTGIDVAMRFATNFMIMSSLVIPERVSGVMMKIFGVRM